MTAIAISGAGGRMGRTVAAAVSDEPDLDLVATFDPAHVGDVVSGTTVAGDLAALDGADVVIEWAPVEAVLEHLPAHADAGRHVVVGSSGFTAERLLDVGEAWSDAEGRLLIVPNFAIGAVLMQRFAAEAARWFAAYEVVELHHDAKADAPSGTALATAVGMAGEQRRRVESEEYVAGSRGGDVDGVRIHSVRLPGLLAHQEVILGNPGEVLTIRHDSMDRSSFIPGVLVAVRGVAGLTDPVTVGLDALLR